MSFDLAILSGDLIIKNGDLNIVRGQSKLTQDLLKVAITPVGANPLQQWYGSLVERTLIGSILDTDIVFAAARSQLQSAIENIKNLQNLQVSSGQKVTPDEQIAFIKDISIIRSPTDPRVLQITIKVNNRVFGQASVIFNVSPT